MLQSDITFKYAHPSNHLSSLNQGQLLQKRSIIYGGAGTGKSTILLNIADRIAETHKVLYVNCEGNELTNDNIDFKDELNLKEIDVADYDLVILEHVHLPNQRKDVQECIKLCGMNGIDFVMSIQTYLLDKDITQYVYSTMPQGNIDQVYTISRSKSIDILSLNVDTFKNIADRDNSSFVIDISFVSDKTGVS
jgi:hypothetical protein